MTKTFTLCLSKNLSCYYDKECENAKFIPNALCRDFIIWATRTGQLPREMNSTASTDEIPGALKIFVTKGGYYRWYWTPFPSSSQAMGGGIPPYTENILGRFFPNAREDGLDTPHPLWLSFS